jgi:formiminotetrahydrofolate cyclodeaminase
MNNLSELSINILFEKFGAGSHKPGSGSAAALQGMLSAQLTRTVIDLTLSKENYKEWWGKFKQIDSEIQNRIYPALTQLFQEDSEQFHNVITLRNARDQEANQAKKEIIVKELDKTLKDATSLPVEMLKYCIEISGFAILIFDYGFKSARGDSGVALNTAISAIAGCLSIINLNLLSLENDEWTDSLRKELVLLKEEYRRLSLRAVECLQIMEEEVEEERLFKEEVEKLSSNLWIDLNLTNDDIEEIARRIQLALWNHRNRIWKHVAFESPIHLLQPSVVLKKILNYQFERRETLGVHEVEEELLEIAGFIDKKAKVVAVSKRFPYKHKTLQPLMNSGMPLCIIKFSYIVIKPWMDHQLRGIETLKNYKPISLQHAF